MDAWTGGPQLLVGQSLGGLTAAAVAAVRADLVRDLIVIDITPGIDPNGGADQIRRFFAGPTDWASRDEMVDRALSFGLGGTPRAAARGVYFNSRQRADGRYEWKHHFAHLAHAAASSAPVASADEHQDAVSRLLGESGWEDLAAVRAPVTLIRGDRGYVTESDAATFAQRVPTASVVVVSSGHNVQEDVPIALGALLRERSGKG